MRIKRRWLSRLLVVALLALMISASLWWVNRPSPIQSCSENKPLDIAVNECEGIAEKAVVDLQEFLEFQRMEKLARKSRVMQLCMTDHGYQINPDWLKSKFIEAQTIAQREHITVDAALEDLKRVNMYASSKGQQPAFWIAAN